MPTEVYLLKVGMNMTEGVVEEWYIADGGSVADGELLYRLETEKVNLDVDAEATGTVRHLVGEGITMKPGDVVGYIYAAGEAIPDELPSAGTGTVHSLEPAAAVEPSAALSARSSGGTGANGPIKASPIARRLAAERQLLLADLSGSGPGGRIVEADVPMSQVVAATTSPLADGETGVQRSSPMARKLARELGLALDGIAGTGPGGRITRDDVELAASQPAPASAAAVPTVAKSDQRIPLKGMRKTIATRMHESLVSTAQLTMDMDVGMDDAVKLRSQLIDEWQDRGLRPTYTDLVIRAVAKALSGHPHMNSQLTENELVLKGDIHVGMAVALQDGLIVPVVRHADRLTMEETVMETARLAAAARDATLTVDDLQDGTFTVSALGMFGVDSFTPIINTPQAGILGVNRIREDTRWADSRPVRTQAMRLSLTWDHRVLDGAPAAQFLAEVRELLEAPYRLLV